MTAEKTYTIYDGFKIKGVYKDKTFATFSHIRYKEMRDMAPIYTMGHKNPKAFAIGPSTGKLAGTLRFTKFYNDEIDTTGNQLPKFDIFLLTRDQSNVLWERKFPNVLVMGIRSISDFTAPSVNNFKCDMFADWKVAKEKNEGMIVNPFTGRKSWL
jgi:hypothetical protein